MGYMDADGHPVWPLTSPWKPGAGEVWKRRSGLNGSKRRGRCFALDCRSDHRIPREAEIAFEATA